MFDSFSAETLARFQFAFTVSFHIPIILAYTAYAYWVFRRKVDPEAGYH